MKQAVLKTLALGVLWAGATGLALASHAGPPTGQLPRWAVPKAYDIALRADPAGHDFSGRARIRVALKRPTNRLWMNARKLDVTRATVIDATGARHAADFHIVDDQAGVAQLTWHKALAPQTVTLEFVYSAPLNRHLRGFYKVDYQGHAYAMTQMEATGARLAFPSFDEPGFKTPFTLHLTVPSDDKAVANTPVAKRRTVADGWQRIDFAPTPPLPTYLVAFAVGPWDVVSGPSLAKSPLRDHETPVRGIAAKGRGAELHQALAQTPGIIAALEHYYDYGYPFAKLDVLAAPDFAAGAMENVGLVTFRDWYMLLAPDSPAADRRGSFEVEAHELAHQWTGDTVTMRWWNDLWLNESFATWMQQKITDRIHPEYHAGLDRIVDAESAMSDDALTTARRIREPIATFGDIGNAFDGITYAKGAAVLGMFESFVGDDVFRRGMRQYLKAHEFGNATAPDLINAIAAAAHRGRAFRNAFASFLDQSGVPYIHTRLTRDNGVAVLDIDQQRYLPTGSTGDAEREWGLPLCVRYPLATGDTATRCRLIDHTHGRIRLVGADADPAWVMPNADGAGYYRFALDGQAFHALLAHLDALDNGEKLAFADAVWAAFRKNRLHADAVTATMQKLAGASTSAVALAPIDSVLWLYDHAAGTRAARARLRTVARQAYAPRLAALGYRRQPGESADAAVLRAHLATFLGVRLHVASVVSALAKQGDAVLAPALATPAGTLDYDAADPDLLTDALTVAVREKGAPAVNALFAALQTNGDADQRNAMITALARVENPALRTRVRNYALTDHIKVGEMVSLLADGNRHATNQRPADATASMWPWFTAHFDAIATRTGALSGGELPQLAADGACSEAAADRLTAFFKPKLSQLPGAARNLAQTAESIRLCAALANKQAANASSNQHDSAVGVEPE